jgi:hypothetical protein
MKHGQFTVILKNGKWARGDSYLVAWKALDRPMARRVKTLSQPWHGKGRVWMTERSSIIDVVKNCRRQVAA